MDQRVHLGLEILLVQEVHLGQGQRILLVQEQKVYLGQGIHLSDLDRHQRETLLVQKVHLVQEIHLDQEVHLGHGQKILLGQGQEIVLDQDVHLSQKIHLGRLGQAVQTLENAVLLVDLGIISHKLTVQCFSKIALKHSLSMRFATQDLAQNQVNFASTAA